MSDLIKELRILDEDGRTLFDFEAQYVVPLYQRAYAWTEKEIVQLIHDVCDMESGSDSNYYLGSLIVSRTDDDYEVIDGQQRLTTLFILLRCLTEIGALSDISDTLRFSCRDKSNYTLKNLNHLVEDDRIEETIWAGRGIVLAELNAKDFQLDQFIDRLKKVVLYRIEVPKNTDLNRYFEIMNTRGEQLEQHDVLKALLMSFLTDNSEKAWFADIWDACSDMTGYVQMHFDVRTREILFGGKWEECPVLESLSALGEKKKDSDTAVKIQQIIQDDFQVDRFDGTDDSNDRIRFESIIEFPYFLLHVLRVFVKTRHIVSACGEALTDKLLDDKKLKSAFERVVTHGVMDGCPLCEQSETFAREFITCLLQCRFLFDKYILKREYVNEDSEGKWSLKELKVSWRGSKRAYYTDSDFRKKWEHESSAKGRAKRNLMLQSCFRVSYTSPKVMHWITELLMWLSEDEFINLENLDQYESMSERIAKREVKKDFLDACAGVYDMGVNTPHIAFNYLDYLLWKEGGEEFTFEFRNSVEHWYPQHPSEGTFERWTHEDGVDGFGNLCIIQRSVNSKFSNMSPEAKKSTFEDMIRKGSLKLRRMASLTVGQDGKSAGVCWREDAYRKHESEMIGRLVAACQ